jgi:hypothetical protein
MLSWELFTTHWIQMNKKVYWELVHLCSGKIQNVYSEFLSPTHHSTVWTLLSGTWPNAMRTTWHIISSYLFKFALNFQVLTREIYSILFQKNKSKVGTVLPVFKVGLKEQGISLYVAVSEPHKQAKLTAHTSALSCLLLCLCNCSQPSKGDVTWY